MRPTYHVVSPSGCPDPHLPATLPLLRKSFDRMFIKQANWKSELSPSASGAENPA